jgi:hypothetical protein
MAGISIPLHQQQQLTTSLLYSYSLKTILFIINFLTFLEYTNTNTNTNIKQNLILTIPYAPGFLPLPPSNRMSTRPTPPPTPQRLGRKMIINIPLPFPPILLHTAPDR